MHTKRIIAAVMLSMAAVAFAQPTAVRQITTQNTAPSGACTPNSCAVLDMTNKGGVVVQVVGTYTASGGLSLQRTVDGLTWTTISATSAFRSSAGNSSATITSGTQDSFQVGGDCTGALACRIVALGAVTGSATLSINTTVASVGGTANISGGAGDASASNQVTGNNSLASIDGKLPALSSGRVPVVDASVVAQASTTSGQSVTLGGGAVTTASPTYTTGQTSPLSLDTTGALRVNVTAGGAGGGAVTGSVAHDAVGTGVNPVLNGGYASAAAPTDVSADGDAVRQWLLRNGATAIQQTYAGTLSTAGAGAVTAGTQRITQASDSPLVTVTGATGDSACGTDNGTCSLAALTKRTNQNLTTLNTSVNADPNYTQTPGSAVPTRALYMGVRTGANLLPAAQAGATAAINVSTATTTQIVALSGSTLTYVTGIAVVAGGTGNITFVYGTGTNCGTGTTSLSGAFPLIANAGLTLGGGVVLVVPAGQALCVTTSAAVQMSGFVTYTQF